MLAHLRIDERVSKLNELVDDAGALGSRRRRDTPSGLNAPRLHAPKARPPQIGLVAIQINEVPLPRDAMAIAAPTCIAETIGPVRLIAEVRRVGQSRLIGREQLHHTLMHFRREPGFGDISDHRVPGTPPGMHRSGCAHGKRQRSRTECANPGGALDTQTSRGHAVATSESAARTAAPTRMRRMRRMSRMGRMGRIGRKD